MKSADDTGKMNWLVKRMTAGTKDLVMIVVQQFETRSPRVQLLVAQGQAQTSLHLGFFKQEPRGESGTMLWSAVTKHTVYYLKLT